MTGAGIVGIVLPIVGTQLFLLWLKTDAHRRPVESLDEDSITLRHGAAVWMIGALCVLGLPGFIAFAVYQRTMHGPPDPSGPYPLLLLSGAFVILGGWIVAEAAVNQIVVSASGVSARPLFGRVKTVRWEDIRQIKFAPIASALVLDTHSGQRIWVGVFMVGFVAFLQALRKHMPPNVYGPAVNALQARYRLAA